jgi:hypothetical protein
MLEQSIIAPPRAQSEHANRSYREFLAGKSQLSGEYGFVPKWMSPALYPFQAHLVEFAVRKGRAAIFANTGLGKTLQELCFARNVYLHTGKPVLIITPLAVSHQTVREGAKFGIEAAVSRDGSVPCGITVTNYERLHYFDPDDFSGAVLDEASAIKAFDGKRRKVVTRFLSGMRYRLAATATPAPNDYVELGTIAEALGVMTQSEMLSQFFKASDKKRHSLFREGDFWNRQKWFFKPHSETPFWRWVCSWARACRSPSDLGNFDDSPFVLPPLEMNQHVIEKVYIPPGEMFPVVARTLNEQRRERRHTLTERCEKVADLVSRRTGCSIVWCELNDEGDCLEETISGAVQIKGSDSDEWKEAVIEWFTGHLCLCRTDGKSSQSGAKEQVCLGSQSTPSGDGRSTPKTRRSGRGARSKGVLRKRTANTCDDTTLPISHDTPNRDGRTEAGKTPVAERDTPTIRITGRRPRLNHGSGHRETQRSCSPDYSAPTDSPSTTTRESSSNRVEAVPSAGGPIQEIHEVHDLSSITATSPANFADSSAPSVTWDSGCSTTTPSGSNAPQCTCGYLSGKRVLISKTSICAFGLNLQCCDHQVFFPTHSYERFFQAVRRSWRFGQERHVSIDIVVTRGEAGVIANLQKKQKRADEMLDALVREMNNQLGVGVSDGHVSDMSAPIWLTTDQEGN